MLEITDSARQELDAFFQDKEKSPVRVFLANGGCSGPQLALALDDQSDSDDVFDKDGYTILVNKDLMLLAQNIKIDFDHLGFSIDSELQLGGGGCAGCSSAGNCSTESE